MRRWPQTGDLVVCTDRREQHATPAAVGLPPRVVRAFEGGHPAAWLRAHGSVDAAFSARDFVWYGTRAMHRYAVSGALKEDSPRARAGLLHPSPDGRWILDPFYGMDLDSAGRPMYDAHPGYILFDAASGDQVFYETGPAPLVSTWLDGRTFAIFGASNVEVDTAAIWVGDVTTGRVALYLGPPISLLDRGRLGQELQALTTAMYPRLRGD